METLSLFSFLTRYNHEFVIYYDSVNADFKCVEKDVTKEQLKLILEIASIQIIYPFSLVCI